MRWWVVSGILLYVWVLLVGCSIDPAVIEALAKDQATACAKITTVYGTVTFARTNIQSGDVTCDGLEVHSPGQVTVPVTVRAVP